MNKEDIGKADAEIRQRIKTNTPEKWAEKFDEKFPCTHHSTPCDGDCSNGLKSFIASTLSEYKKELVEKIEEMKRKEWDDLNCEHCGSIRGESRNVKNTDHNLLLTEIVALINK